jgi:hypothetical protein
MPIKKWIDLPSADRNNKICIFLQRFRSLIIFRSAFIILLASCIIFLNDACVKRKIAPKPAPVPVNKPLANGLPDNYKRINGYFYACYMVDSAGIGPSGTSLVAYAAFNDPPAHLMPNINHHSNYNELLGSYLDTGNVAVGGVLFNTVKLNRNSFQPISYIQQVSNYGDVPPEATWSTEGNGSFTSVDLKISRGFPALHVPSGSLTISSQQAYTLNTAGYFSNYDSVSVVLHHSYLQAKVLKTSSSKDPVFVFSTPELARFQGYQYTELTFQAFNYSNCTVNDKIYTFELGRKVNKTIFIQN